MIILFGYILGSAYLPFKSNGLLLTNHLSVTELNKFLRAEPHKKSFDTIVLRLYEGSKIGGYEDWFDKEIFESLGLSPVNAQLTIDCDDNQLRNYRKEAIASLWYYPQVFKQKTNSDQDDHLNNSELLLTEGAPLSIIFLKNNSNDNHVHIFKCSTHLIFMSNS